MTVFGFNCLRTLNLLVYPVLLSGFLHVLFLWMTVSAEEFRQPGFLWLLWAGASLLAGWFAWTLLVRRADAGRLEQVAHQLAIKLFKKASHRFLLGDDELIADCALLRVERGPGLLVLTDRRLLVASFRGWPRKPWQVTECDRFAVKAVREREPARSFPDFPEGIFYRGELEIELVGVGRPQRLAFVEPRSRHRLAVALAPPKRVRPARHGIRLIQYFPRRKALKRRYIETLLPARAVPFIHAVMLSTIFPGFGQLRQGRVVTGMPYTGVFLVSLAAMLVRGVESESSADDVRFLAPMLSMLVIWLMSVLELFMHRHIHGARVP